jgi:hypothetical protein
VADTIGAELTVSSARTLYWTVTTDATVTTVPKVAFLDVWDNPTAATVWNTGTWTGPETVTGTEHVRTFSVLVAGPAGPVTGSPVVLPAVGEYGTWVRVGTSTEQIEIPAQIVTVK